MGLTVGNGEGFKVGQAVGCRVGGNVEHRVFLQMVYVDAVH